MSFAAMAAWQAWALAAGVVALATWFFFLKVRAPRVVISSLLLWQRVFETDRPVTWWERIRKFVSWALAAVTAAAMALALARPAPGIAAARGGRVLVVLDSSWSMDARRQDGATRWERALAEARTLIRSSGGGDVALATTSDGLVEGPTSDAVLLEAALDRLSPGGGQGLGWPRVANVSSVHLITDGATPRPDAPAGSGPPVIVHSVFDAASNVGITAFDVRPSPAADDAAEAYIEIANYAPSAQPIRVVVTRGTTSVVDTRVEAGAGEALRQVFPLPREGSGRLLARVSAAENALSVDDEAVAWLPGAEALNVLVVSERPGYLQVLLERVAYVRARFVAPAGYDAAVKAPTDVVVFDRWVPSAAPAKPAFYLAPPAAGWLGKPGAEEKKPRWTTTTAHPVLNGVDAATVSIDAARGYAGDGLTAIARAASGLPLLSVKPSVEHRAVVLGFALPESNLALQPAFPVLVLNALDWLARPAVSGTTRPGRLALDAGVAKLTGPDGAAVPIHGAGDARWAIARLPGWYLAEGGGMRQPVGVNAGDPQVSNLQRTTLSETERAAPAASGGGRPWWPYFLIAAFALISLEWWTWNRRVTV